MPIRQGKAKLWFNTKQEQDEFDDRMISAIRLQSSNYDDDNFAAIFVRKRQENYLELTEKARSEIAKYEVNKNSAEYIDKYHIGKRDHSFWRSWTIEKFGVGYAVSYLLLRQLPVRNFYARFWIMLMFISKVRQTLPRPFGQGLIIAEDQWTDKRVRNYGAYQIFKNNIPATLDGRLPQQTLWKMNQPGYLRPTPHLFVDTAFKSLVFSPETGKVVEWDGTFNMPLQGLASPKHKDAKFVDFIYE